MKGGRRHDMGPRLGCRFEGVRVPAIYSWMWAKFVRPELIRQEVCIGCDAPLPALNPLLDPLV